MKLNLSLEIKEKKTVYPPSEDSYLMVENVTVLPGDRVLEIGPGAGIVSLHCAAAGGEITAVDINPDAVELTRKNARKNGLNDRIKVLEGDLFSPVKKSFDVIIFNPPYLTSDPAEETEWIERAWNGGEKGREIIERFLEEAVKYLSENGRIYLLLEEQNRPEELMNRFEEYEWKLLAKRDFFFEHLMVYLLRLKKS